MNKEKKKVAYFCMEYGLDNKFKLYAGGLGILAGDILKTARQYNFPLIGIGILWSQGYTRQLIDKKGKVYDSYPFYNNIYNYLEDTGLKVKVKIREQDVYIKLWKLDKFDNTPLYLLDTNLEINNESKWISGQLYGWFEEERIAQEMVLGIGGIRAIRELDLDIDLYHFNEGHAVLAATELIREKMQERISFENALNEVRKKIVFTTHTPIKEGNEEHSLNILNYMGACNGLSLEQMVKIGNAPFNMTVAGLRLSRKANAVSSLHGHTACKMWENINKKTPIISITNGVHHKSWVDPAIIRANNSNETNKLWSAHQNNKRKLLKYVEDKTAQILDIDSLIIAFARRAAPYKRSDLIFKKMEIIEPFLINNKLQIIFSGKAHPLDNKGKKIISNIIEIKEKHPQSVVFLEDYDMEIGSKLTKGADVWLNNPRRPLEACGTSGMKAAMNGVLNLSILDGWWPEACQHGINGWQFGNGYEGKNQDEYDLKSLYQILKNELIPTYYKKHKKWVKMMQASINTTYKKYSARRMLTEYYARLYKS